MDYVDARDNYKPWWKRIGWLLLIWSLGVGTLAVVAFALKRFMHLAGLAN
jgi:hypothetical protein